MALCLGFGVDCASAQDIDVMSDVADKAKTSVVGMPTDFDLRHAELYKGNRRGTSRVTLYAQAQSAQTVSGSHPNHIIW